jgi:hypothetical protein
MPAAANFVGLTTMETPPAPRTATLTFRENASKMTLIDKTANLRDVCEPQADSIRSDNLDEQ